MKRITLVICCLMLSLASFAQNYDTGFKQTHRLKISGKTTIMKGQLTYDGKDQLSMIYSDPEGDYFIIDGTQIKMNLLGKKAYDKTAARHPAQLPQWKLGTGRQGQ